MTHISSLRAVLDTEEIPRKHPSWMNCFAPPPNIKVVGQFILGPFPFRYFMDSVHTLIVLLTDWPPQDSTLSPLLRITSDV